MLVMLGVQVNDATICSTLQARNYEMLMKSSIFIIICFHCSLIVLSFPHTFCFNTEERTRCERHYVLDSV